MPIVELRLNDPSALVALAQQMKRDFFDPHSMFLRLHVYFDSEIDRLTAYLGKSAANGDIYLGEVRKYKNMTCSFRGKLWLSLWDEIVDVFATQGMSVDYYGFRSKDEKPPIEDRRSVSLRL